MWLGLDNLHSLTSQASYTLQITLTDFDGEKYVAVYEQFQVRTFQTLMSTNEQSCKMSIFFTQINIEIRNLAYLIFVTHTAKV